MMSVLLCSQNHGLPCNTCGTAWVVFEVWEGLSPFLFGVALLARNLGSSLALLVVPTTQRHLAPTGLRAVESRQRNAKILAINKGLALSGLYTSPLKRGQLEVEVSPRSWTIYFACSNSAAAATSKTRKRPLTSWEASALYHKPCYHWISFKDAVQGFCCKGAQNNWKTKPCVYHQKLWYSSKKKFSTVILDPSSKEWKESTLIQK